MTNAEKFREVFGFEFTLAPYEADCWCPFQRTKCRDTEFDCFEDCVKPFWESEYQGTPTKTDLISKEEALDLFPLILSGELLTIATVREQLRKLQTVEAVPMSVIEKIELKLQSEISRMEEIERTCDYKRPHTLDWVLKLIEDEVKECTHEED